MWWLAILVLVPHSCAGLKTAYRLVRVDSPSAYTAIRLWHELHVARGEAHDFAKTLKPTDTDTVFVAACHGGEFHALASCKFADGKLVADSIAYHPERRGAAVSLLRKLCTHSGVRLSPLQEQSWLLFEGLYMSNTGDAGVQE